MGSSLELSKSVRRGVADLLNGRLAELIDLGTHIKEAHWHARGPGFIAFHEFLDGAGGEVGEAADEVAERVIQLGGRALGLTRVVAKASKLPAYPEELTDQSDHAKALAGSVAWCADRLRAGIEASAKAGDAVTADLLTRHTGVLDVLAWKIRSHLR